MNKDYSGSNSGSDSDDVTVLSNATQCLFIIRRDKRSVGASVYSNYTFHIRAQLTAAGKLLADWSR